MPRSKLLAAFTALDNVDFERELLSDSEHNTATTTLQKQTRAKLSTNRVTKPRQKVRQPGTKAVAPTTTRTRRVLAGKDQNQALGDELVGACGDPSNKAADIVTPRPKRTAKIIKERPSNAITAPSPRAPSSRKATRRQLDDIHSAKPEVSSGIRASLLPLASNANVSLLQLSTETLEAECGRKHLNETASLRETEDFESLLSVLHTETSAWKEESSWPNSVGQKDSTVLRRRLGDLTQQYTRLDARYRDMREIGLKEAERNFDRLKRQSDDRTKAAALLIESLKTELATQTGLAEEAHHLQIQLESSSSQVSDLLANVSALNIALTDARANIRILSAKLASSRSTDVTRTRVHDSALKPTTNLARHMSTEAYQIAQLREDLYADLTGMIIRGVKCGDTETVYDCIQTGSNGTLHFKLSLATNAMSDSFQGVQFTYKPQLDVSRDVSLIDLLPDYLTEEIAFPRQHAAKFYARVTKSLMENVRL